jgi:hypothetical protein
MIATAKTEEFNASKHLKQGKRLLTEIKTIIKSIVHGA